MAVSLHETCQEYVTRRLSEGWKVVSQKGYHLILSSPDGNILRPVDLRNDVETLNPNESGDYTNIASQFPDSSAHWAKVDEVGPYDGDATTVYMQELSQQKDAYALAPSSIPGGSTINSVTVFFHFKSGGGAKYAQPFLRLGGNETEGTEVSTASGDYEGNGDRNEVLARPGGGNWAIADLVDLQVVVGLRSLSTSTRVSLTQVYVEVDYTLPVTEKTSSETGSGADAKKTGEPLATYSRSETGSGVEAKASENPLGFLVKSETGSGLEHILDRILFLTSESGSGLDTILALLGKMSSETGSGLENSYLHILEAVRSSSDTGSGVEVSALTTLFQRDETGAGVEAIVARAIHLKEYPTGALDFAQVLTAAITGTGETGTGAEASLVSLYQKKTDSGSGVDASTLKALFSRADTGAGAEAITLLAAMIAHDTGQGIETVLTYLRTLVDSGEGADVAELIGFVGRRMRMIVYTKNAFGLKTYTSETGK